MWNWSSAGSFAELEKGREAILSEAIAEFEQFFPKARTLPLRKSAVLKEARGDVLGRAGS